MSDISFASFAISVYHEAKSANSKNRKVDELCTTSYRVTSSVVNKDRNALSAIKLSRMSTALQGNPLEAPYLCLILTCKCFWECMS